MKRQYRYTTKDGISIRTWLDVDEILLNLPDASLCLRCVGWKYDECVFEFCDPEEEELGPGDDPRYLVLDRERAEKGLQLCLDNGHFARGHFDPCDYTEDSEGDYGIFDAEDVDCIVQYGLFGELVYG